MARFQGKAYGINGTRSSTPATRQGAVVRVEANGFGSGLRVIASGPNGADTFEVYATGGSYGRREEIYLGKLQNGEWMPSKEALNMVVIGNGPLPLP